MLKGQQEPGGGGSKRTEKKHKLQITNFLKFHDNGEKLFVFRE